MTRRSVLRTLATVAGAWFVAAAPSLASGQTKPEKVKDPVCGMMVDPAAAKGGKSEYKGKTYYFCSDGCKKKFDKEPAKYAPDPKKK